MWRRYFSFAAIAAGALLLATEKAAAQFGPGHQGPHWNDNQSYGSRRVTPARMFTPAVSSAPTTSQSFFNTPVQHNRTVLVDVHDPANAKIWFDDDPTK